MFSKWFSHYFCLLRFIATQQPRSVHMRTLDIVFLSSSTNPVRPRHKRRRTTNWCIPQMSSSDVTTIEATSLREREREKEVVIKRGGCCVVTHDNVSATRLRLHQQQQQQQQQLVNVKIFGARVCVRLWAAEVRPKSYFLLQRRALSRRWRRCRCFRYDASWKDGGGWRVVRSGHCQARYSDDVIPLKLKVTRGRGSVSVEQRSWQQQQ